MLNASVLDKASDIWTHTQNWLVYRIAIIWQPAKRQEEMLQNDKQI